MSQERCSQHEVYLDAHPAANKSAVPSHFPLLMSNTHTYSHTASAVNSSPHCHHVCTGGYLSLERTAGTYLSLNSLHFFFSLIKLCTQSYLLFSVDFPAHQLVRNSKPLTRKMIAFTQYFTHYINQWILLRWAPASLSLFDVCLHGSL